MKWPFRYRYWLVECLGRLEVHKARFNPCDGFIYTLIDGPFDEQEDVVRALHFWSEQPMRPKLKKR